MKPHQHPVVSLIVLLALLLTFTAPSPTPTLPISYDDFCYNNHAGAFQGLVTGPTLGVVVLCRDADFIFYKSAIPTRVNHWPGARGTMPPGRTS
jgi:hypothetical protein